MVFLFFFAIKKRPGNRSNIYRVNFLRASAACGSRGCIIAAFETSDGQVEHRWMGGDQSFPSSCPLSQENIVERNAVIDDGIMRSFYEWCISPEGDAHFGNLWDQVLPSGAAATALDCMSASTIEELCDANAVRMLMRDAWRVRQSSDTSAEKLSFAAKCAKAMENAVERAAAETDAGLKNAISAVSLTAKLLTAARKNAFRSKICRRTEVASRR